MAPVSIGVNIDIHRIGRVDLAEQADVAVIGGGQSGPAATHALRGQGLQPVVLEASERAGCRGDSAAHHRLLAPHPRASTPPLATLVRRMST
ncbi:FAD-dependent oxidoreductase [Streptomyces chartreusis]|uniref:FAD-dependent oxidoreductase n=1 Tax=Streptomyces chartreusis TaxID=1969 RepID=UPI002E822E8F|nr:FAD-dependent oxidoreductase [Streptomyces chartreusis]WUB15225.1 NAD(P)-binding protein [Streptomyces chartreusis]